MDPLFLAELNERLFVHFTQGRWMAPFSDRLLPVLSLGEGRIGHLACGNEQDIARARTALVPGQDRGLAQAYQRIAPLLRILRAQEGFDDPVDPPQPPGSLPYTGPLIVLSAAALPVSQLAGVLIAGAARGVIWKPAPRAAASAHLLMTALGPAAQGGLALIQGDHQTGAMLAGQGPVIRAT